MPDSTSPPWLSGWIEIQRELLNRSAMPRTPADLESLRTLIVDHYRNCLTPEFTRAAAQAPPPGGPENWLRWQAATQRYGAQIAAIAADAFRRFAASLTADDATLPPITTLRQLFELWVDCGEEAYAAAAHEATFADAQAELLMAFVELRVGQPGPGA